MSHVGPASEANMPFPLLTMPVRDSASHASVHVMNLGGGMSRVCVAQLLQTACALYTF